MPFGTLKRLGKKAYGKAKEADAKMVESHRDTDMADAFGIEPMDDERDQGDAATRYENEPRLDAFGLGGGESGDMMDVPDPLGGTEPRVADGDKSGDDMDDDPLGWI